MKNLIIFADYGLDDAAATATIFKHADQFKSITIIPIGGNVPAQVSYKNCMTILSFFPEVHDKLTIVDTTHIQQPSEYLAEIHGNDGMGDIFTAVSECNSVPVKKYETWLNELNGDEVILSLGPMTLVRPVFEKHECRLIIMGGCVNEEPNFGDYEFNHCLDPEAFAFCTQFPHVAITLDTCRVEKLDMRKINITGDDVHSLILQADQRLSITRNEDGCYVWDDVAACYLIFPDRFEIKEQTDPHGNRVYNAVYTSDRIYFED